MPLPSPQTRLDLLLCSLTHGAARHLPTTAVIITWVKMSLPAAFRFTREGVVLPGVRGTARASDLRAEYFSVGSGSDTGCVTLSKSHAFSGFH